MISFSKALKITESEFRKLKLKTETVKLKDAVNRIIAENIYADTDQPLFTNSGMDGYAVKYIEGQKNWIITHEISAGSNKKLMIKQSETAMIMTGSRLPEGADTVIPIENAHVENNILSVKNSKSLYKGLNVRKKGEDIRKGKLLIGVNTLLNPKSITAAASCGKNTIKVFKKLKIGIIATGSELVDIATIPKGDKIRESNLYSLHSAITELNMIPLSLGIIEDNKTLLKQKVQKALNSGPDIILTTGGVSAGKYDYMKDIFKQLGIKIVFHKVNIKPGKPVLFGIYGKKDKHIPVFGLPGNPVSCYVDFILFVRNVIMKILMPKHKYNLTALLNETVSKKDTKRYFLRGTFNNTGGVNYVSISEKQSSANVGGLNISNCLVVIKEKQKISKKGSCVECIMI